MIKSIAIIATFRSDAQCAGRTGRAKDLLSTIKCYHYMASS